MQQVFVDGNNVLTQAHDTNAQLDGSLVIEDPAVFEDLRQNLGFRKLVSGAWEAYSPPDPVPSSDPTDYPLSPFQFRAMMRILAVNDTVIEAAIDATIVDATENAIAKARFYEASSYNRAHPLFALLGPAVGLSDAQIDDAWMTAKDIR